MRVLQDLSGPGLMASQAADLGVQRPKKIEPLRSVALSPAITCFTASSPKHLRACWRRLAVEALSCES